MNARLNLLVADLRPSTWIAIAELRLLSAIAGHRVAPRLLPKFDFVTDQERPHLPRRVTHPEVGSIDVPQGWFRPHP